MPTSYPLFVPKSTGASGTGLFTFTDSDIKQGDLLAVEERPLVAVLDCPRLTEACSWCFDYLIESRGVRKDGPLKLRVCTGCRILRFCGVPCQSAAWKHSHKYECKIFSRFYPNALPNTARMVLQILVRQKAGQLSKDEWESFLKLRHHIDDFKATLSMKSDIFQNLQLMARAAHEYSGTYEDLKFVESMAGRILINTLTLTSSLYTPLGLALSLSTSLLNHSCTPNTAISYSGARLSLHALTAIDPYTELTISYIDITFPPSTRRVELATRYFFNCTCPACTNSQTLSHPDPPPYLLETMPPASLQSLEDSATALISSAVNQPPQKALASVARAYTSFSPYPAFPAYRQPLARARTDLILALLTTKRWVPALIQALMQRFYADPETYGGNEVHPARVAKGWVLAQLVGEVGARANGEGGEEGDEGEGEAARALGRDFGLGWGIVVWATVSDTAGKVGKSHGPNSRLAAEVGGEVRRLMVDLAATGRRVPSDEVVAEAWRRLERIAAQGWDWWRKLESHRRKGSKRLAASETGEGEEDGIGILVEDAEPR